MSEVKPLQETDAQKLERAKNHLEKVAKAMEEVGFGDFRKIVILLARAGIVNKITKTPDFSFAEQIHEISQRQVVRNVTEDRTRRQIFGVVAGALVAAPFAVGFNELVVKYLSSKFYETKNAVPLVMAGGAWAGKKISDIMSNLTDLADEGMEKYDTNVVKDVQNIIEEAQRFRNLVNNLQKNPLYKDDNDFNVAEIYKSVKTYLELSGESFVITM